MSIREKQESIIADIVYLKGGYTYQCTWNDYIKSLEFGLEVVSDCMNDPNMDGNEASITRALIEELLKVAGRSEEPTNNRDYKGKRIYELSCALREKIEEFPRVIEEKEKPTSLNGLVKSLQIFKLRSRKITTDFYETGDDLYGDIRKIVLRKGSPLYQKFYAGKVVSILKEGNKETDNLLAEDYELERLVNFIDSTPEFYCRRRDDWTVKQAIVDEQIQKGFYHSHLKLLVKNDEKTIF